MALTAAQVINRARDLHPALSVSNAPRVLAFRQITEQQRDLIAEIARTIPGYLATTVDITLPLAVFDSGSDLSALIAGGWLDLLDLFFTNSANPLPDLAVRGTFAPYEQRDMPQPSPAWTFRGNTIYLLGEAADYTMYSKATLSYTPLGSDLTSDASVFLLPDDARECLAWDLAVFWLMRLVGLPMANVTGDTVSVYADRARAQRDSFTTRILALGQRQNYSVRNVMGW